MGVQIGDDEKNILNGKLFSLIDTVRMSPDVVVNRLIKSFLNSEQTLKK